MLFTTDQQTLDDLNIFGKHGGDSVFAIFNKTVTRGGAAILEKMFRYPLSEMTTINRRSNIIQYFATCGLVFPFDPVIFDSIEQYLSNTDERTKLAAQEHSITKKLSNMVAADAWTLTIHKGIAALTGLLKGLHNFIAVFVAGDPYQPERDAIILLLEDPAFASVFSHPVKSKLSATELAEYDVCFRFRNRELIKELLQYVYYLDVYLAVAKVSLALGFNFPKAFSRDKQLLSLENLYHPQVKHAVPNSIEINPQSNVIFLTGANMAGKSTFMKSLSVALYLAHMGFPVAASKMEFSVLDGIYTTINLPDNLGMGASHFYAEVLRAKKMAIELKTKKLFVLFDELFRGTNVKDAGEATIAFTEAFAGKKGSIFVISTHIIEAGVVLKERCENINFMYLPTLMDGNQPVYTYKLEQGITEDRHGMVIINNEGILRILDGGLNSSTEPNRAELTKGLGIFAVQADKEGKSFVADKQTIADLNLLGKYKPNSIYSLFNKTQTAGGERLLQEMFQNPFTDHEQINERSALFRYFHENEHHFSFKRETFEQMESYLGMGTNGNFVAEMSTVFYHKFSASFLRDEQYDGLHTGLLATVEILNSFREFLDSTDGNSGSPYESERKILREIFSDHRLQWLTKARNTKIFSLFAFAKYDYLLKHTFQEQMDRLLKGMHMVDVYLSVSNVARVNDFHYATALPATAHLMKTTALRHPGLAKGIANTISFQKDQNLMFLTGANMAGKSTFMKAFGIAVYLSHMGFPVAAEDIAFSVLDGIYSSINVADDLNMGHSHFYAEVLRVKHVADEVASGKNMVVLFDELFKGTNVKDAYDGTLSVTAAFAAYRNCFYIVSTHIIEVAQALKQEGGHINFAYLPTAMDGNMPRYTYLLQEGITTDRQGMMIIENEGILEMLQEYA